MDYQNHNYNYYRQTPPENKRRSVRMENASFFLGIAAISTIWLGYPAIICGCLSIVFALLSRGGEMTLTPRAKIGLILGAISLGILALMFTFTLAFANIYYNGLEDMMLQEFGIDLDLLMQNYM